MMQHYLNLERETQLRDFDSIIGHIRCFFLFANADWHAPLLSLKNQKVLLPIARHGCVSADRYDWDHECEIDKYLRYPKVYPAKTTLQQFSLFQRRLLLFLYRCLPRH